MRADLSHPRPKRPWRCPVKPDERIELRSPWQLHGAFRNACYRRGRSMSDVLREMMQAYVDSDGKL